METEPFIRQLVITSPDEWQRLSEWYRSRGMDLASIPAGQDGIATYAPTPATRRDIT